MKTPTTLYISPSSLNLFFECPFCFWLEKRHNIRRPSHFPYHLNLAVDDLLKKEFDRFRREGKPPPLLFENNISAKLFSNQELIDEWRDAKRGIRFYDKKLDAYLFGAVDDVIEFKDRTIAPLDYKSTGMDVPKVYDRFQLQMDVYTFLFEQSGYTCNQKGYLAFYIVERGGSFRGSIPFRKELHVISTDSSYVRETFEEAVTFLREEVPTFHSPDCEFGKWFKKVSRFSYQ